MPPKIPKIPMICEIIFLLRSTNKKNKTIATPTTFIIVDPPKAYPHFGQAAALSETSALHSGHLINAMTSPHALYVPQNQTMSLRQSLSSTRMSILDNYGPSNIFEA